MQRILYLLSLLMIFVTPWEQMIYFESLGTMSRVIGLCLAGLWSVSFLLRGARRLTTFHLFVLAFVCINALSMFWSVVPEKSLQLLKVYVQLAALSVIIWDVFRTEKAVLTALQTYVLGALVPAASTIMNYVAGAGTYAERYATSASGMNATAFVLALSIPVALYLAVGRSELWGPKWLRVLNFMCAFIAFFAIALTATRFAVLMSVPAWGYLLNVVIRSGRVHSVGIIGIAAICLVGVGALIPENTFDRLTSIHTEISSGDLTGRRLIWGLGLESFSTRPLLGIGAGAEGVPCRATLGEDVSMHNAYLTVLVELGMVGLMAMIGILGIVIYHAFGMPRQESIFWLTVLAGWGIGNLAVSVFESKETWIVFSLLMAHWAAIRVGALAVKKEKSSGLAAPQGAVLTPRPA